MQFHKVRAHNAADTILLPAWPAQGCRREKLLQYESEEIAAEMTVVEFVRRRIRSTLSDGGGRFGRAPFKASGDAGRFLVD